MSRLQTYFDKLARVAQRGNYCVMSSLLTFLAAFAMAESSAPLPDSLKGLADSAEAFAHSISKLDKQTDAVVADACFAKNALLRLCLLGSPNFGNRQLGLPFSC